MILVATGRSMAEGSVPCLQGRQANRSVVADIEAHITGTVWKIEVQVGDKVAEGDTVAVLESMKMEMPVESEVDGTVSEVLCATGDAVTEGQPLVRLV